MGDEYHTHEELAELEEGAESARGGRLLDGVHQLTGHGHQPQSAKTLPTSSLDCYALPSFGPYKLGAVPLEAGGMREVVASAGE